MAVKVQQTKLPEFWGQKEKDSISANEFVKRVDKMMSANNWTGKVAFDNFGLAFKGETNTWLDAQVLLKKIVGDRECWSIICPFFKEEFATESDDKLILDGLTHMAMQPTENVRSFFGRLNKVNTVILDAYHSYTLTLPDPAIDATGNHVITPADFQAYKKTLVENVVEFYILNQFRAALLLDLRRVINLQPMHTLDLDTAVRLAIIELRSKDEAKGSSKIQALQQEDEEEPIEAISHNRQRGFSSNQNQGQQQTNRQQPKQGFRPLSNFRTNNQQQWRSNPGNNSNRNKMTCIFCWKQGHRQEECRKRINANQPCLDSNGKNFWP